MDGERRLRADTRRTRERLLDVMGSLLEEKGLDFSLPDLARESGVAIATVYRHFDDLSDLRQEFYNRFVGQLLTRMQGLADQYTGEELLRRMCHDWVANALPSARAATFIRSAEGYLERVRAGDPFVLHLHAQVLIPVIDQLISDGVLPDQSRDYAALIWITLFDERVLVDLAGVLDWDVDRIATRLRTTLLGALRASNQSRNDETPPERVPERGFATGRPATSRRPTRGDGGI